MSVTARSLLASAALAALLAGAAPAAPALLDEPPPPPIDCTKDFETLYSIAYNAPDVAYEETATTEEVWSLSRHDTYIFTREGHPAHPAILLRSFRPTGKRNWGVSMSGCGFGDQTAFQQMMKDYKGPNGDMLDALMQARPIGPPVLIAPQ